MATMVKEKRKEKKRNKEKSSKKLVNEELQDKLMESQNVSESTADLEENILIEGSSVNKLENVSTLELNIDNKEVKVDRKLEKQIDLRIEESGGLTNDLAEGIDYNLIARSAVHDADGSSNIIKTGYVLDMDTKPLKEENVTPSAPVFEEEVITPQVVAQPEISIKETKLKVECMPLQEAVRLFGGQEISEVRAISENEEVIVEAGPISGPEHPLVDLLSSFRSSLNALERGRISISNAIIEEEKSRCSLWKVEKRRVFLSEKCPCGSTVSLQASYDYAELQKEKIPAARMRLEAISREVQNSYCHHQHSALLAYCQIEELVYETIRSSKGEIREALSLILQALRLTDGSSEAFSGALQRWAVALSAALLDGRDLRQLVFLIHHLFRQTRSVRWAARIIRVQVTDLSSAARVIGLLELMMARSGLETAVECTEDLDDVWEEVGRRGEGSAVSEGRLRERDALALLRTLPLRQLLAKLALFSRSDVTSTRDGEWGDVSGGSGVLKVACGVRTLLGVVQRALVAHPHYERLRRELRGICISALHSLASLHMLSRSYYHPQMELKVVAELEACFEAAIALSDKAEIHHLPTMLLGEVSANEYCCALMAGMHSNTPSHIGIVECDSRVRVLVRAAEERGHDCVQARTILQFLCQTAIKRKPASCKNPCEVAARDGLPRVLRAHPYLHATALHTLADMNQEEPVDASAVGYLSVREWRPGEGELVSVLQDWWGRCPSLVRHLLLQMDYTPHVGVSLEAQLAVGAWLCEVVGGEAPEWAWRALRALRVHRSHWSLPLKAPPPRPEPADLFSSAFALLASSWGHSVPMICAEGVRALSSVARARACEGAHCLAVLMRVMRQSPESVALTPEFTEVLNAVLGAGPSLVSRALGRGGPSGAEVLQQIVLEEIANAQLGIMRPWLRGLWAPSVCSAGRALLDVAMRASRDWPALDAAVAAILQGEGGTQLLLDSLRECVSAPLLCEAALRGTHASCELPFWPRLLDALAMQRAGNQRAHVDNALRQIGITMSAEDLVIYRVANACLSAPFNHPAHLTLWRLFFHLYLQRPPSSPQDSTSPIGPMFFSGIIKSRKLNQLKKRIQDAINHHRTQSERHKPTETVHSVEAPARKSRSNSSVNNSLLKVISISDLTGERLSDTESEEEESEVESEIVGSAGASSRESFHLYSYHVAAEKLVREYSRWLEEGERVRACPHHADIARFVSEQGLDAAWRSTLPSTKEASPPLSRAPRKPPPSHLQQAIQRVLSVRDRSSTRSRIPVLKPLLDGQNHLGDARVVYNLVDSYLKDVEALAREWSEEVNRLVQIDAKVWQLVGELRKPRPLPSCLKACEKRCKPINFIIKKDEWVISTGAEQGILENRRSAMALLRRLSAPRPKAARSAAALQTLARHVRSVETARRVAERAGRSADVARDCVPAHHAVCALVDYLAERWLSADAAACAELVSSWAVGGEGRRQLCSSLISPRRLSPQAFALLYGALLATPLPPHAAFSYLSRFEMGAWAEKVDSGLREKMLEVLVKAAQKWGPYPDQENHVLLELIGVHAEAVCCGGSALCVLLLSSAKASARGSLPPPFGAHSANAARAHAHALDANQLGGLLRELGAIWWQARSSPEAEAIPYEPYASSHADILATTHAAFVDTMKTLGHDIEQLSWFIWSALREAWSPWVQPSDTSLLPISQESEGYGLMVERFLGALRGTIDHCPDGEEYILRYAWEWTVHSFLSLTNVSCEGTRIRLSALLSALAGLRWQECPWMHSSSVPLALQVSMSTDREITSWCTGTLRRVGAQSWLRGLPDEKVAPHLAALLAFFCSPRLQLSSQTMDEACRLPWWRLPEAALDSAFEQFFVEHHNPAVPYHEVPQFRVLLSASGLINPEGIFSSSAKGKRLRSVSQCVRAATAPQLTAHVPKHAAYMLRVMTELAPQIESSEGELEELLSRAIVIMCFKPAAGAALPVWQQWISRCEFRMRVACAVAVASLTALDYFTPLAEATAKAHLTNSDIGWAELRGRWSACAWDAHAACAACAKRRYWHAAYALLPAGRALVADAAQSADSARATDSPRTADSALSADAHEAVLCALAANDLTADDEDPMMAVWVCVACRVGLGSKPAAGRGLLARWASEPRRTLLQVVGIQQHYAPRIRLLCRLAQCILDPNSDSPVRAYESACSLAMGSNPDDIIALGKSPRAVSLPRLAMKLFPGREVYFREELEIFEKI